MRRRAAGAGVPRRRSRRRCQDHAPADAISCVASRRPRGRASAPAACCSASEPGRTRSTIARGRRPGARCGSARAGARVGVRRRARARPARRSRCWHARDGRAARGAPARACEARARPRSSEPRRAARSRWRAISAAWRARLAPPAQASLAYGFDGDVLVLVDDARRRSAVARRARRLLAAPELRAVPPEPARRVDIASLPRPQSAPGLGGTRTGLDDALQDVRDDLASVRAIGVQPPAPGDRRPRRTLLLDPMSQDNDFLFTSESVTEGHPDKVADQISDGVLDAVLARGPDGRVACETLVNTGLVVVSGEISTEPTSTSRRSPARRSARSATSTPTSASRPTRCAVLNAIDKQSPDIAQGVDHAFETRTRSGRRRRARRRRRGRPGDDVRLRLERDRRADAAADLAGAQARQAAGRRAQGRTTCPTCARTARPRCPCATSTGARSRSRSC